MKLLKCRRLAGLAIGVLVLAWASTVAADWEAGRQAFKNRDYATAIQEFEKVTQTNPDYAGAYYMLGLAQSASGKASAAVANLRKAVELEADNVNYKIALGQVLIRARQYSEAYSALKGVSLSAVDSQNRTTYALYFAKAATASSRPGEAVKVLNAQIGADSKNAGLYKALGEAQGAAGDDKARFNAFSKAFDLDPKDEEAALAATRAAIAVARREAGSTSKDRYYTDAAKVAERLVALKPTFEHSLLAGEAWLGAKEFNKALQWFGKAKELRARNSLLYFYSGQCYSSLARFQDALSELQEALAIGATGKLRTQIYNQMGYVYAKMADYKKAKSAYQEAGNAKKVAEMQDSVEKQEQNIEAAQEQAVFRQRLDALRLQIDELRKIGQDAEADELQKQLDNLEKSAQH